MKECMESNDRDPVHDFILSLEISECVAPGVRVRLVQPSCLLRMDQPR